MQLFASAATRGDEIRRLEHRQMLGHRLARHFEVLAELRERLSIVRIEKVQKLAAIGVGECLEQQVGVVHSTFPVCRDYMQVFTCMSTAPHSGRRRPVVEPPAIGAADRDLPGGPHVGFWAVGPSVLSACEATKAYRRPSATGT